MPATALPRSRPSLHGCCIPTHKRLPLVSQVVKEYTGKVDTLLVERKDTLKEKEEHTAAVRKQEQVQNQYATLMPLALPAPPTHAGGQIPGGQGYDMGGFQGANTYGGGSSFQGYH